MLGSMFQHFPGKPAIIPILGSGNEAGSKIAKLKKVEVWQRVCHVPVQVRFGIVEGVNWLMADQTVSLILH
jgi:hypothetical protein